MALCSAINHQPPRDDQASHTAGPRPTTIGKIKHLLAVIDNPQ